MNHDYADIRERISEPICWWDESAVPRYRPFSPEETADIYADETVLMFVECQNCGTGFHVCLSVSMMGKARGRSDLADLIRTNEIHFGDPPNIDCCPSGPTMNSVPRRVIEYWSRRGGTREWQRDGSLEVAITCDWADPVRSSEEATRRGENP